MSRDDWLLEEGEWDEDWSDFNPKEWASTRRFLLRRRIEEMIAVLAEHQLEPQTVTITCKACGCLERETIPLNERDDVWTFLLLGWTLSRNRPYLDLCPRCAQEMTAQRAGDTFLVL
jgi:hypothetical protein